MRKLIATLIVLAAVTAQAQDDTTDNGTDASILNPLAVIGAVVQEARSDALLRSLIDAAPLLAMERVEIEMTPSLEIEEFVGVSADASGNIHIFQRGDAADPIIVVDPDGNVLRSFGKGLFARPHSVRVDPAGNVWAVDSNTSKVVKFSADGEVLLEIDVGDVPDPDAVSCAAADVAFGNDGLVYVADGYCNARIVVYDPNGRKVGEWGRAGTGPGEFNLPHGIAVSPEGDVYVADRENGRVQWFSSEGDYLGEWAYGGRVLSVAFSPDGEFYVSAEPKDAPQMVEAIMLKIDRADGSVIGRIDDFGHEIEVGADGSLLPARMSAPIVVYRP